MKISLSQLLLYSALANDPNPEIPTPIDSTRLRMTNSFNQKSFRTNSDFEKFFIESTLTQLRHSKSTLNFESTFIVIQLTSVRVLIRSFKSQINSNKIINDFQNFSIKSLTINCELNEWCTMVHYIALNTTNAKSKLRDDLKLSN